MKFQTNLNWFGTVGAPDKSRGHCQTKLDSEKISVINIKQIFMKHIHSQ